MRIPAGRARSLKTRCRYGPPLPDAKGAPLIYRARYLVTMAGPPIPDGWMRVHADRITYIGDATDFSPAAGEEVMDFSDSILLPGLINAHCHLELGMLRGLLPHGGGFSAWVARLRKLLADTAPEDYRQAVRLGALECLKHGTTTVVDVGNTGEALRALAESPIRSFPNLELIGLDPLKAHEIVERAWDATASYSAASDRMHPGLACHAPYSCSVELLRLVAQAASTQAGPFTMHVAESAEESDLFQNGTGALLDFCRSIYPAAHPHRYADPVVFLQGQGLIPEGALFAHCNTVDREGARTLAARKVSVAHCPRSRDFFGHPDFPLDLLLSEGVNICLGTDSLASNDGLSLFDEMAEFRLAHPQAAGRDILAMATANAALALGREDLGCLRPGSLADFIALELRSDPCPDLYEEIVVEEHDVSLVVVGGEELVC